MDSSGVICPSCGRENPADSRFCSACGAPLAAEAPVGVHKTVTVVFCDLVGSTALGEATDPEVLRELMGRYHAELRSILERHGGTVEKFVGGRALQRDQRRARSQRRPPQRGGLAVSSRQGLRERGDFDRAEVLVREAVEIASGTDYIELAAGTWLDLAEILRAAGKAEAPAAAQEALMLYERKGNLVGASRAIALLDAAT